MPRNKPWIDKDPEWGSHAWMIPLRLIKLSLIALTFLTVWQATAQAATSPLPKDVLDRLNTYVDQEMNPANVRGGVLVLVKGDEMVYFRAFGVEHGSVTPTKDTSFEIGSINKTLTAVAIMQLRDAGRLDLDAPVWEILPWFSVFHPDSSVPITIRHLLSHTSGLPGDAHQVMWADPKSVRDNPEEAARRLSTVDLFDLPGQTFRYDNLNYTVLGVIVETLSGMPYAEYIDENILKPLGMTHATAVVDRHSGLDLAQPHEWRYGRLVQSPFAHEWGTFLAAAGNATVASAADLSRFVVAQWDPDNPVLSIDSLQEMYSGGIVTGSALQFEGFEDFRYDLGVFHGKFNGTRWVGHLGQTQGTSSVMWFAPDDELGVVLLIASQSPSLADGWGRGIISILMGQALPPSPRAVSGIISKVIAVLMIVAVASIVWWVFAIRTVLAGRYRPGRQWIRWLRLVVLTAISAGLWFYLFDAGTMAPYGFYGWPVDWAVAIGALLSAASLWTLYSIIVVFGPRTARRSPNRTSRV